ncbi:MAG: hypothetical protein ABSG05_02265 [Candidatus Pacearchaeota archaeon]|jgi:Zn-dependent protease
MLGKREIGTIILATVVLAVTINFLKFQSLLGILLAVFIIIVLNVAAKKVAAYYLDSEAETRIWNFEKSGYRKGEFSYMNIPLGIIIPILVAVVTLGNIFWMAITVFDVKPKVSRAAKRHGLYSFSEMTEYHIGLIAAAGIFITLVAAVVGYLIGFSTFAKLSIFYAFFNMLPISELDGNKIFFGNTVLWSFLATLVLIGVGYVFFLT